MDWLRENNEADVKAVDEARHRFFGGKLKILKDGVSILGISQKYVLNKVLEKRPEYQLSAPKEPCKDKCNETHTKERCKLCKYVQQEYKECPKNQAYELLKTFMVGGLAQDNLKVRRQHVILTLF